METVLFWDFDGTLTYSDRLWSRTLYQNMLREVPNSRVRIEEIRKHTANRMYPWDAPDEDYTGHKGALWWDLMNTRFCAMYRALDFSGIQARRMALAVRPEILNPENYTLYEDAAEVLDICKKRGYRNYILSNNYPELPEVIAGLGLSAYFEGYVVSACAGYDKPRLELFAYAKVLAGNPAAAVMIGDNPGADIAGGKNAGMRTILVHRGANTAADAVCGTLREIPGVLSAWGI